MNGSNSCAWSGMIVTLNFGPLWSASLFLQIVRDFPNVSLANQVRPQNTIHALYVSLV